MSFNSLDNIGRDPVQVDKCSVFIARQMDVVRTKNPAERLTSLMFYFVPDMAGPITAQQINFVTSDFGMPQYRQLLRDVAPAMRVGI